MKFEIKLVLDGEFIFVRIFEHRETTQTRWLGRGKIPANNEARSREYRYITERDGATDARSAYDAGRAIGPHRSQIGQCFIH